MLIHQVAEKYPNSGQVARMLNFFHDDLYSKLIVKKEKLQDYEKPKVMMSILVNMCSKNPRFYNIIGALFSLLLSQVDDQATVSSAINARMQRLPNTSLLDLWLQRAIYKFNGTVTYSEPMTHVVSNYDRHPYGLWNNNWLRKDLIVNAKIINDKIYNDNLPVTSREEVDEFRDIPS